MHLENIKNATKDLPSDASIFLDRGLPDVGAYAKIYNLEAPDEVITVPSMSVEKRVQFVLEPLKGIGSKLSSN